MQTTGESNIRAAMCRHMKRYQRGSHTLRSHCVHSCALCPPRVRVDQLHSGSAAPAARGPEWAAEGGLSDSHVMKRAGQKEREAGRGGPMPSRHRSHQSPNLLGETPEPSPFLSA